MEPNIELRLAGLLARRFFERTGVDLCLDPAAFALVIQASRAARARLESGSLANVSLPFIAEGKDGPLHLDDVLAPGDLRALAVVTETRSAG